MTELQPDVDEVLQAEPDEGLTAIPVRVEEVRGPVRTQALPRKGGATRTRLIGPNAYRILPADPHRARVTLLSTEGAFRFAFTEAGASEESTMALWPAGLPYEVTARTDVWVRAVDAAATLTVVTENWAEGR
jgi:hypothetical protein